MPASQKKALADDLIQVVSDQAAKIPDPRPNQIDDKIPLHDAVMSALAMFHLKFSSLLQFDEDRREPEIEYNLNTLYRVGKVPSDTHIRCMLDPVPTREVSRLFTALFHFVQRSAPCVSIVVASSEFSNLNRGRSVSNQCPAIQKSSKSPSFRR